MHYPRSLSRSRFTVLLLIPALLTATLGFTQAETVISQMDDVEVRLEIQGFIIATDGDFESDSSQLKRISRLAQRELERYPKKISIDELHQIADTLTLMVRQDGYNFDSVFLPPQKVASGLVRLSYQKAILSRINVINRSEFPDDALRAPFKRFVGEHLYGPDLENTVHALRSKEELMVFAFYSRGAAAGEVTINVSVDKKPTDFYSLSADNYGSEASGEKRLIANFKANSVLGNFDRVGLALLRTDGDGDVNYGYASYQYWLSSLDTAFEISAGTTQYGLGNSFEALDAKGDSRQFRISSIHVLNHSPASNKELSFDAFLKKSWFGSGDVVINNVLEQEERSKGASIGWRAGSPLPLNWQAAYAVSLTAGKYDNATQTDEDLRKGEYRLFLSRRFNAKSNVSVQTNFHLRGQSSDKSQLPSLETLSLSGINAVRGYDLGRFTSHSGALFSADISFPQLLNREFAGWPFQLQPFIFFDKAQGKNFSATSETSSRIELEAAGVGLSARWGRLTGQVTYASPQNDELNEKSQVYVQIRWQ